MVENESDPRRRSSPKSTAQIHPAFTGDSSAQNFTIFWHSLNYRIRTIRTNKQILNSLNGYVRSGEITAILGPSGAGKSTLLECICGRKYMRKSEVKIRGTNRLSIGFVPQTDHLLDKLTVRESFLFASKFRAINTGHTGVDHDSVAASLVKMFGLQLVADTPAQRCSGGQRKRLSIGLEVVSKPNILILDEPTTGLDSPSCAQVVKIMEELVADESHRMAIVCTIHQPSPAIFNSFDMVYVLSLDGQCIYHGSPLSMVKELSKCGLNCPKYSSPADYVIEIASGEYGEPAVTKLALESRERDIHELIVDSVQTRSLSSITNRVHHQFWKQMPLLFRRSQIIIYRDPYLTIVRVVMALIAAGFLAVFYGRRGGAASGCLPRELELWTTPLSVLSRKFETELVLINENVCLIFLFLMVGVLTGLAPVLLNFPLEMHVLKREYHNGWYSCLSYFAAKTLSDLPLQIVLPVAYVAIIYNLTGQPVEWIREISMFVIMALLSFNSQSISETISAIWMDRQAVAVFVGLIAPLPMILFGGFLVKVSSMPDYLQPVSWFSFLRFAFEATLVTVYGLNRCDYQYDRFLETINASAVVKPKWGHYLPILLSFIEKESDEPSTDSDIDRLYKLFGSGGLGGRKVTVERSLITILFDIDDLYLLKAIAIMIVFLVALKIITYLVLLFKVRAKY